MGARPPIVYFQKLRDLGTVLSSGPSVDVDRKHWEYLLDATAADITVNLPPAIGSKHMVRPLKVDTSTHIINIIPVLGDLIHDAGLLVLSGLQWEGTFLRDAAPGFWDDLGPNFPQGVPPGGTTGQVLAKASDDDNDTEWVSGAAFTLLSSRPTSFNDFLAKGDAAGWWP